MPITAGTLATDVLTRIRDPNAQMVATDDPPTSTTGNAFVLTMLTLAQWYVNLAERLIVNSFSLALSTNTNVYGMDNVGPSDYGGILLSVTDGSGNEVTRMEDKALGRTNRGWFTATGSKIVGWGSIGKTLLFIFPGFASAPPTVTVRYPSLPTVSGLSSGTNMSVPDDTTEHVARLAELLCRIKTRQLTGFDQRLKDLATSMQLVDTMSVTGGKAD